MASGEGRANSGQDVAGGAMRVIAGQYRSRVLNAPGGLSTRPTSDRLRETLFNVLSPRIQAASFLDLYAGSGAVGIEALSRGAAQAVFVEREAQALAALRGNLDSLGIRSAARVHAVNVRSFLQRRRSSGNQPGPFHLAFLDPPYDAAQEYAGTLTLLDEAGWLAGGAMAIAEHRRKERLEEQYGTLRRTRVLQQGDAALSFYSVVA
ncbi:MAG: 16S rRNA (guanine(966)-N(2))-methyltransferase RsmD [Acidobacteriota bacterium]